MPKTETLLDQVISKKIALGAEDREAALVDIALSCDQMGMYGFAKMFCVLDEEDSAETFALEFMTAYNNEIGHKY